MFRNIVLSLLLASSSVFAHTAIMSCFDNGDKTVTCEAGFSDGSSASGVKFYIEQNGKKVLKTQMNEDSEVTFKKPKGSYIVVFDAGEGHKVHIKSENITE